MRRNPFAGPEGIRRRAVGAGIRIRIHHRSGALNGDARNEVKSLIYDEHLPFGAMRFVQICLAVVCCGLMVSCAHRASAPSAERGTSLVLDNHGGYSHAGRRVVLW